MSPPNLPGEVLAFLAIILGVGVVAGFILAERLSYVLSRASVDAGALLARLQDAIVRDDLPGALGACDERPAAPIARVCRAGLVRANRSEREIETAIEEAVLEVGPLLTRRTTYLPALAHGAVLLGLLGTVVGLIRAFSAVAGAEEGARQVRLALDISGALVPTALGLLVAIPTLAGHAWLVGRTHAILEAVDRQALRLTALLTARRRGTLAELLSDDS
jgi:biopolymer transport protein ExbB